jgi:hypothetical protein
MVMLHVELFFSAGGIAAGGMDMDALNVLRPFAMVSDDLTLRFLGCRLRGGV